MTAVHLVRALCSEVKRALKNYRLEGDEAGEKGVTVYEQYVPEEVFGEETASEYHPYVAVMLNGIEDDNQAEATVTFMVSVYGLDRDTWQDLLNLLDTLRIHLLEHRLIGQRYRMLKPMETKLPPTQPVPFWYGELEVKYLIFQPEERSMRSGRI